MSLSQAIRAATKELIGRGIWPASMELDVGCGPEVLHFHHGVAGWIAVYVTAGGEGITVRKDVRGGRAVFTLAMRGR